MATLAVVVSLLDSATSSSAGASPVSKEKPPPKVTQAQVDAAQNDKDKLAGIVGQLNGQIASQQIEISNLNLKLQHSQQVAAQKREQEQRAQAAAAKAHGVVVAATRKTATAHVAYVNYIQAAYYSDSSTDDGTGTLLTANDPSDVLERSTLVASLAHDKINAVADMQTAQVTKSNAEAKAKIANANAAKAAAASKKALAAAQADYQDAQAKKQSMQANLTSQQTLLAGAKADLTLKAGQHAAYVQYQAIQAAKRLAARRLAAERAQAAAALKARQAAEAARDSALAQAKANAGRSSGGSHSVSGGGHRSGSSPSLGGSWTAAKGRAAAQRALNERGMLYIWDAGSKYGPDEGDCSDPVSPCGTIGYDCSGLVLYAWYANWDHYAATQYSQAGSYHPGPGNFKPGDLLFWSENGTQGGIGHVAIYIGGGDVVQAPQSGDVVKVTPWQQVEYGYYGATRPLT